MVKISPTSTQYVNPMDINLNYSDDDNPLALKVDFLLSFCDIVVGSKDGLQRWRKRSLTAVCGMCTAPTWQTRTQPGCPFSRTSTTSCWLSRNGGPAHRGGAGAVCHRLPQRVQPPDQRGADQPAGVLQHQGAGQAAQAAGDAGHSGPGVEPGHGQPGGGKTTRYYVDEFHLLLKGELASWSVEIWKRVRNGAASPPGSRRISRPAGLPRDRKYLRDSDFIYMLNQAAGDRQI